MNSKRVVVTGMGVVSPIGIGIDSYYNNLVTGKKGLNKIRRFDTSAFSTDFGGEVNQEEIATILNEELIKKYNLSDAFVSQALKTYSIVAVNEALSQAGISIKSLRKRNCALIMSTAVGGMDTVFPDMVSQVIKDEINQEVYESFRNYSFHSLSSDLCEVLGISGYSATNISACIGGLAAVGYGVDLIKSGMSDLVIAGGADVLTQFELSCFNSFRSLEKEACYPFDSRRKGLLLSEGAGVLVLERSDNTEDRPVLAEIVGYEITNDSFDMTAPDRQAISAAKAIKRSYGTSNLSVDYICAHGTGTKLNDISETNAIKNAFGSAAYEIPVSSIKGAIGHMNGAAGAMNIITGIMALNNDVIPGTLNYGKKDPECDLDYVPETSRQKKITTCLTNAYAFGGQCSSMVMTAYMKD